MNKIELVPLLDASKFPSNVEDEFTDKEISTHYRGETFLVDWVDKYDFIELKLWLLKTYGEDIKQYKYFAINPS